MGRMIGVLDFTKFPDNITLKHGRDGEREWWECWKGRRGIVVQRSNPQSPYYIFFIEGEAIRSTHKAYKTIEDAVEDIKALGFNVNLEA